MKLSWRCYSVTNDSDSNLLQPTKNTHKANMFLIVLIQWYCYIILIHCNTITPFKKIFLWCAVLFVSRKLRNTTKYLIESATTPQKTYFCRQMSQWYAIMKTIRTTLNWVFDHPISPLTEMSGISRIIYSISKKKLHTTLLIFGNVIQLFQ